MRPRATVVLITAALVLVLGGSLLGYMVIRSSANSSGQDKQADGNVDALASFVDIWHVYGSWLRISADGTGLEWWNVGSCSGSASQSSRTMCAGNANIVFSGNSDGRITGKITKIWYSNWYGT